jgi:uncharacterized membrane protein
MFGRSHRVTERVGDAAESVIDYVDPLAKDEKLRRRLAAAIAAGVTAGRQVRSQTGVRGLAMRLAHDRVLREELAELAAQLDGAAKRARKARSHKRRNVVLFVAGIGVIAAASPSLREAVRSKLRRSRDDWGPSGWTSVPAPKSIQEEIEVAVPVTTAYNQWTQFEEFPRFMDGVEEVRQLDDTLLHWAAAVGGKRAEWDAKILEQEPDRRIAWESTDGKQTRGTVTFEPAGPERTRIRLQMSYMPDGITEKVGSAARVDDRRVRGDLERFRELIEGRHVESGAWRGEVHGGVKTE